MLLGVVGHLQHTARALPAMREGVDDENVDAVGEELLDRFEVAPWRIGRGQFADDKPARHLVAVETRPARFGVEDADLALSTHHAARDAQGGVGLAAPRWTIELNQ